MRYFFSPPEMKIAYDMVSTNPEEYQKKVSLSWEDSSKIIGWFSKAVKRVLKIPRYKNLPFWGCNNSQIAMDRFVSGCLINKALQEKQSFPLEYRLYHRNDSNEGYFICFYRIFARNMNDEEAVKILAAFLMTLLKKSYPELYAPDKSALTLMCINKYHKDTLFGQLPKEVAKIIAEQVKEGNRLEIDDLNLRK